MLMQTRPTFLVLTFILSALLVVWSWILYSYRPDVFANNSDQNNVVVLSIMWTVVFALVLSSLALFMKDKVRSGMRFFGFGLVLAAFLVTILVFSGYAINTLKDLDLAEDTWLKSYYGYSIVSIIVAGGILLGFLMLLLAVVGKVLDLTTDAKHSSRKRSRSRA